MIKIIISALLIVLSVFIYAKLSKPSMSGLVFKENQNTALLQKNINFKRQLFLLKAIKKTKVLLKKQKTSTYMFTLLSFTNYLKNKGFSLKLKLNKLKQAAPVINNNIPKPQAVKLKLAVISGAEGFKPYELDTKFTGVKKINITLNFKGYYGISPLLAVTEKLYMLFPIKYTNFTMNKKNTVINFNLYSFKGV